MYPTLLETIELINNKEIGMERKNILTPLVDFIQKKVDEKKEIRINFICTHNSRRSHLAQIWAQTAAAYFDVPDVISYSGGTEETALFPKVAEILTTQGFSVTKISDSTNPVYAVKYDENNHPVIGFSKKYDHPFNPVQEFAAVMTCSQADGGCPFIAGAEKRIPITFEDPKISDGTPEQARIYHERSLEIGAEMLYIFSQIKK